MLDISQAIAVNFPLRGEWVALNTPARRVPSHGTDYFGQTYAFDFVQAGAELRFSPHSLGRQLLMGVPAGAFYCWDEPVYSAFPGKVIAARDGWPDRGYVLGAWELFRAMFLAPMLCTPRGSDYRPLAGNFVLVQGTPGVALYAHLRVGSVQVEIGQAVTEDSVLAKVGNSGNTTMPHLHFHLMDEADPLRAHGKLCVFRSYERFADGRWTPVKHGVPHYLERVRAA